LKVNSLFFPAADTELSDLLLEFFRESTALSSTLKKETRRSVSDIIQRVSCYHANLLVGNHIRPLDIEQAAKKDFSDNPGKRALQEWSYSYIYTQKQINIRLLTEESLNISSPDYLEWMHSVFYSHVPEEFLRIKPANNYRSNRITPGVISEDDTEYSGVQPEYSVKEFAKAYDFKNITGEKRLLASIASHSRLQLIVPVREVFDIISQFYTISFFKLTGLDAMGLFSLSRMISGNKDEYRGTLDLSAKTGLAKNDFNNFGIREFCRFFVTSCLKEIAFMKELLDTGRLQKRIAGYAELRSKEMLTDSEPLREEAKYILTEVMLRGSLPRGEAKRITGLGERTARSLLSRLLDEELLISENHKAPVKFNIPPKAIGYYLPGLYPESVVTE